MPEFDIAIFCYPEHVKHLDPLIASIQQHIAGHRKIRIIWDDTSQYYNNSVAPFTYKNYEVRQHSSWNWGPKLWAHGWIRQQILKLRCFEFSDADYTWVVDSDILILQNFNLFDSTSQKPFLRYSNNPIQPQLKCYSFMQQYFSIEHVQPTVITNGGGNCVFDHAILQDMDRYCRQHNGNSLTELLEQLMSYHSNKKLNKWRGYPFSEFETYGNYAHQNFPTRFVPTSINWGPFAESKDIQVY